MIGRVVLAALLCGIVAGLVLGAIQQLRVTPLILAAEVYEKADDTKAGGKGCVENMPGMTMCGDDEGWKPSDGLQRTALTTLSSMMAGAGYAAMLAGLSLVLGAPITRQNGYIWGLCGFLAVTVATGAGLPPEIPGMHSAELLPRQVWWAGTILATGASLYLIAFKRELWAVVLAVVLIALPHLIGAPQAPNAASTVPPGLAAEFASNTVAAAAIFWGVIGLLLGISLPRAVPETEAT